MLPRVGVLAHSGELTGAPELGTPTWSPAQCRRCLEMPPSHWSTRRRHARPTANGGAALARFWWLSVIVNTLPQSLQHKLLGTKNIYR